MRIPVIGAIAATALLLSGCGTNEYTPLPKSPAESNFAAACAGCHGPNGEGKFGFLLKIAGSEAPAQEIADKIANGGIAMPAFPNIGEADRLALAAYLKH